MLSIFSKIFEKLIHKEITNYFDKHNYFNNSQYGFLEFFMGASWEKPYLANQAARPYLKTSEYGEVPKKRSVQSDCMPDR